ncbi:hypothetical protein BG015_009379 [Linnemannia schmuckeri]|uniref:Uncharacterized protein n=1 Tax=Linnemannia schmuckeri TaxID=64567 RepID=A0A9P5RZ42_9FUNG|nr:hypothetical protein BG015_009379 [Linnemannia schmuckeri]
MAQVLHLEQFRLSQEAAKCFDDDLDFCPSLTAKELSEIILASILAQKENQAKQQQQRGGSSPVSPTTPAATANPTSRAITIVDPNSRAPLFIAPKTPNAIGNNGRQGGRYSGSTTPATAGLMGPSDSYFSFMPSMGRQQQQQQQVYNNMYGSHAYAFSGQHQQQQHHHQQAYSMGMTSPTMSSYSPPRMASRIPIVNPDNGTIVSLPETPSWNQHHFVAVR